MIRRPPSFPQHRAASLALLLGALVLPACKPPKSVDYYRTNPLERDSMVNRCLATNSNNSDCYNAITAEAERWGTKDIDGFTVMITGDGHTIDPAAAGAPPGAPPTTGPDTPASAPPVK